MLRWAAWSVARGLEAVMIRTLTIAVALALLASPFARRASAQDIPGIEICTVEKTMERRTSCLQSNINFLQRSATQAALDQQKKLDAANRAIEALQAQVQTLQSAVAALKKPSDPARPPTAPATAPTAPAAAPEAKPPSAPAK
jgi:hypothetical protein